MHDELLDEALRALDDTDDEALRIYADWLGEHGDARGELIQLQLLPPTPERTARCEALLEAHAETWLGEAASMLTGVVWRRGFPYEARLAYALPRRPVALESLRILHLKRGGRHHREQTHALLLDPVFHGLHRVDGPLEPATVLGWLKGEPRPLTHLEVPLGLLQLDTDLRTALDGDALPALGHLLRTEASHPRQWRHLLRTRVGRQIHTLDLRCTAPTLSTWLGYAPDLTLRLRLGTSLVIDRTRDTLEVNATLGRLYEGGTSVAVAALLAQVFATLPADRFHEVKLNWPRAYVPAPADASALASQIERLRAD